MMNDAVKWALNKMVDEGIASPKQHGFIDLVRRYFIDNDIEHKPMSFEDIKPYL